MKHRIVCFNQRTITHFNWKGKKRFLDDKPFFSNLKGILVGSKLCLRHLRRQQTKISNSIPPKGKRISNETSFDQKVVIDVSKPNTKLREIQNMCCMQKGFRNQKLSFLNRDRLFSSPDWKKNTYRVYRGFRLNLGKSAKWLFWSQYLFWSNSFAFVSKFANEKTLFGDKSVLNFCFPLFLVLELLGLMSNKTWTFLPRGNKPLHGS